MSRLLRAGGFSPASAIPGDPADAGLTCASCGTSLGLAWVHITSMQLVCRDCLPNPNHGGTGQRMAKQITRRRARRTRQRTGTERPRRDRRPRTAGDAHNGPPEAPAQMAIRATPPRTQTRVGQARRRRRRPLREMRGTDRARHAVGPRPRRPRPLQLLRGRARPLQPVRAEQAEHVARLVSSGLS